jgi:hypothetical protein
MRALKSFLLGTMATGMVAYVVVAVVALAAQADDRSLAVAVGPVVILSVAVEGATKATTFGAGILLIAVAGGLLNLLAAQLLRRRL